DLVVQEIRLSATLQLAHQRLADRARALAAYEGLDRQASLRRRRDHREIADALQAHRERAGNRRRGEREHVHFGTQRLQRLLLPYAEAMLLVDDDESEPGEAHVGRQQLVRADRDVDVAGLQTFDRFARFLFRAKARQLRDAYGQLLEAVAEGAEML